MRGNASKRDPFAGYKPVKVAIPVVDIFESPAEKPCAAGKRERRSGNGGRGGSARLLRAAALAAVLVFSAALVLVVAAFSSGIMYDKPVQDVAPELAGYADEIKPFADAGRSVRESVLGVVAKGGELLDMRSKPATNQVASVASGIVNVSTYRKRVQVVETAFDGSSGNVDTTLPDANASAGLQQEVKQEQKPRAKATARNSVPSDAKKPGGRVIDPRMKEFYNGGMQGRRVGEGNIREFYGGR